MANRRPGRRTIDLALLAASLLVCGQTCPADDEQWRQAGSDVLGFVRALPLAADRISNAAASIALVSSVPPHAGPAATDHPSLRHIHAGPTTPPLEVLHQYGHHVFYHLLPDAVQPLYWHPTSCADIPAMLPGARALQPGPPLGAPLVPAGGTMPWEPEDGFSEAAAWFFVICLAAHQHARDGAVDPSVGSLHNAVLAATHPDMPLPQPEVGLIATLCGLYAGLLRTDPALAFADFYQGVLAHRSRSAGLPMPARTMEQWLLARGIYGGMPGVSLETLPTPVQGTRSAYTRLIPYRPAMLLDVTVNGTSQPARAVRLRNGDRLRTGAALGLLELAGASAVLLGSDVACELLGAAELAVDRGQVYVEGPGVITTPLCSCTTGAGGTAVAVNLVGETTIGVVSGAVSVKPKQKDAVALSAGETLTIMADGELLGPSRADPLRVAHLLPLGGAQIAPGPPGGTLLSPVRPDTQTPTPGIAASTEPKPDAAGADAVSPDTPQRDLWRIHSRDLLPDVVLCTDVDAENNPRGVDTVFPPNVGSISLLLNLDLGTRERQVKVRWMRGGKTLSGRIIRANGKRRILNSLSSGDGNTFPTGRYDIEISIDDRPAADLTFFIQG